MNLKSDYETLMNASMKEKKISFGKRWSRKSLGKFSVKKIKHVNVRWSKGEKNEKREMRDEKKEEIKNSKKRFISEADLYQFL